MPSFDTNRIVGLDAKFAQTIQCPICLMILNEPLITKCGHSFCHQCLKETVESGAKVCPKCRKPFTKKRPKESLDDSCVTIAHNRDIHIFSKNLGFKEIIGKLKITCDFEFNGCEETVELDSLSKHINECKYKSCKSCGFRLKGSTDDHLCNCIEVIKNERNQLKDKYEKCLEENKKLKEDINGLRNEKNEWKDKYQKSSEKCLEENKKLREEVNGFKKGMNDWKLVYEMKVEENRKISEQKLMLTNEVEDLKLEQINHSYYNTIGENAMEKCITSGKCDNYLIGLMYENIDENQYRRGYDLIVLISLKAQYRSLIKSTRDHCTRLLSQRPEEIKISMSIYKFREDILVPNAIIKAISIVCKCKFETAEQILKIIANQ